VLNVHHLELFYHVARCGGISRAVRGMPYGIQQPTISGQILLLEKGLGTKLFERSPFRLTAPGEKLFAFVRPFFERLDAVETELQQPSAPQLRIGASEFVFRDYLPAIMKPVHQQFPDVRLNLQSGFSYQLETMLLDRQIDVAIDSLENRPSRLRCMPLVRVPLVLLVPRRSRLKSSAALWANRRIKERLITLPAADITSKLFERELQRRRVEWPATVEASSLDAIAKYVANGDGIGLSVDLAPVTRHPGVRVVPLESFPPLTIGAYWLGDLTPVLRTFLDELRSYVRQHWPDRQCDDSQSENRSSL
jgi:DNA-binding transcriptional LysR family regulator